MNADKQCPAPSATRKYDKSKGKQWIEGQNGMLVTVTNLYGKVCRDVRNDTEVVEGICVAQDQCQGTQCYGIECKKPTPTPGDTTGAGGTPNQTGENTPWKPIEQPTPEEIKNAFENGTKPVDFISQSGSSFNDYIGNQLGDISSFPTESFGGQSIFEQALNPVSSFNSDYFNTNNTSSLFPEANGAPQGLESLNANNGYDPSAPYSAPMPWHCGS